MEGVWGAAVAQLSSCCRSSQSGRVVKVKWWHLWRPPATLLSFVPSLLGSTSPAFALLWPFAAFITDTYTLFTHPPFLSLLMPPSPHLMSFFMDFCCFVSNKLTTLALWLCSSPLSVSHIQQLCDTILLVENDIQTCGAHTCDLHSLIFFHSCPFLLCKYVWIEYRATFEDD